MQKREEKMTTETPAEIREILKGLPCPSCPDNCTDAQLKQLARDIDDSLFGRFGTCDRKENDKIEVAWWEELEYLAVYMYNMPYYGDLEEEEND